MAFEIGTFVGCQYLIIGVFGNRIPFTNLVSNAEVSHRVPDKDNQSVSEVIDLHQTRWLGYILDMPSRRLFRHIMFPNIGVGWKKAKEVQIKA